MKKNSTNWTILMPFFMVLLACSPSKPKEEPGEAEDVTSSLAISLFDGKTLRGWDQKNGTATYKVVNGTIVGTTSPGSPNSFLCTTKSYRDFELEFDAKVDTGLNSGVQIRSKQREQSVGESPNETKGRVIGPQVEIVSGGDDGGPSGFIWREATGDGWITEPTNHQHFKNDDWNHYRILAKGPQISTWINGNMIEDVRDTATYNAFPSGFIGLQVHGIKEGSGPYQVAWKNIMIREL